MFMYIKHVDNMGRHEIINNQYDMPNQTDLLSYITSQTVIARAIVVCTAWLQ